MSLMSAQDNHYYTNHFINIKLFFDESFNYSNPRGLTKRERFIPITSAFGNYRATSHRYFLDWNAIHGTTIWRIIR